MSLRKFDVIVVGAGHAGIEAAGAAARMGCQTLLLTHNLETVGEMSCNPAFGGIGKGHLLREIDAMGGICPQAIDRAGIQFRTLNSSKGPAVRATRAQTDRHLYKEVMRKTLASYPNLTLFQQPCTKLLFDGETLCGVSTAADIEFYAPAVIICAGTFLNGLIHIGLNHYQGGRAGDPASIALAENLKELGLKQGRLKTGTPARLVASSIDYSKMQVTPGASYAYLCLNETVNGIELFKLPETGDVPLIADMSSDILTRPVDVTKFGAIMFGAQKNVAPAGLTVTIVRKDLIGKARKYCPSIFDWAILDKYESMYNTPNTFAWYMAGLAFKWIKDLGGTEELERRNIEKSELLYNFLDQSPFYRCQVAKGDRSRVNCVFNLQNEDLNAKFLAEAKARNLIGLKGHKVLGGMRASIYNAMPIEGVRDLVAFLQDFAQANS